MSIKNTLNKEYLLSNINTIIEKKRKYGTNNIGNNKKININYVNSNFKEINIDNIRNIVYVDNLARLMDYCGYYVIKDFYIKNEKSNNLKEEDFERLKANLKKELDMYRISFDSYTSEQSLYDNCIIENTLTQIRYTNYCYIKDDELWLKTTAYGDNEDQVLIKKDGNYTDLPSNIAYNLDKINRKFDLLIDVFDLNYPINIKNLKAALKILNKNSNILDIKIQGLVKLIKNGNEIESKNIKLKDLTSKAGINSIRYFFAIYDIDDNIDFNIDLILKQSNENPIYCIENSNAIICNILRKGRKILHPTDKYITLKSDIAYNIINKLLAFEDIITNACVQKKPYLIAHYAYELATLFHSFYEKEQIITEDEIYTNERLNLLLAIKIALNNSLDLIGIIPREEI